MKFTEEHKRKISEALKGHIPSLETCKKISMANKGKKSFAIYPEFRFEISNGRTLCLDCHKKTDTFGPKSRNPETHLLSIKRYWASL